MPGRPRAPIQPVHARLAREKQWNDAIAEHDEARRAGDSPRQNAALIRALDLSRELDQADKRAGGRDPFFAKVRQYWTLPEKQGGGATTLPSNATPSSLNK